MDTWNTKLIHTRERWSFYKDVNRGCTSLPTNTRRKTHVPPGERQTGISVRRSIKQVLLSQTNLLLTETHKLTLKHIKTYLLENGHSVPLSVCQLFDFFFSHNLKPVFYCFFPNLLRIFPNPQL